MGKREFLADGFADGTMPNSKLGSGKNVAEVLIFATAGQPIALRPSMLTGMACQRYMPSAKVSENTCLSHSLDHEWVFRTFDR